jgi:uncharacterized SAM-binding protein YcdF (DUF218 family)
MDYPPKKVDFFVLLSYAVADVVNPTLPTKAMIKLVFNWWKKFPRAKIIMSTGDNQGLGISNARVMANYAVKIGIPRQNLIEEDKSKTTYENLIYCQNIINNYKSRNVTYVLYDLHVRRTLAILKKLGWQNYRWISIKSPGSPAYGIKFFQSYSRLTIYIYENLAYVYNWLKGEL